MVYTSQEMSDQCFWNLYFGRAAWGYLVIAVFVLIMFLAGRIWLNKSGDSEVKRRLNNLKFWFTLWLSFFGYVSAAILYAWSHPSSIKYIAECHFWSSDSWLNEKVYPGWLFIAVLIIPIIFEYWSIKTGKKNPSNNNLSPATIIVALTLIFAIAIYIFYVLYQKIMR